MPTDMRRLREPLLPRGYDTCPWQQFGNSHIVQCVQRVQKT